MEKPAEDALSWDWAVRLAHLMLHDHPRANDLAAPSHRRRLEEAAALLRAYTVPKPEQFEQGIYPKPKEP